MRSETLHKKGVLSSGIAGIDCQSHKCSYCRTTHGLWLQGIEIHEGICDVGNADPQPQGTGTAHIRFHGAEVVLSTMTILATAAGRRENPDKNMRCAI